MAAPSGLLNERPKATQSKEAAPEVLSYRQRLYDRETLMLPNEPWNPAARLAQVRARARGTGAWVWVPARARRPRAKPAASAAILLRRRRSGTY